MPTVTIRPATPADLDIITELETVCFLPAEAASREALAARLSAFADRFFILFADGLPVSYVGGLTCNADILADDMYAEPAYHDPNGRVQMIFSVATLPEYRRRGYAAAALRALIETCRSEGREAVILTCKPRLVHFYASVGFADQGLSKSNHGGAVWHQMRLDL